MSADKLIDGENIEWWYVRCECLEKQLRAEISARIAMRLERDLARDECMAMRVDPDVARREADAKRFLQDIENADTTRGTSPHTGKGQA